jgi:hypothetical protein
MSFDPCLIPGCYSILLTPTAPNEELTTLRTAFRAAWSMIPDDGRTTLLRYWEQGGARAAVYISQERFAKINAPAEAAEGGRRLYFNPAWVFSFPEPDWLGLTILHELGHAFLYATNDPAHHARKPDSPDEILMWSDRMEQRVRDTLQRWILDVTRHDELVEWVKARHAQL